MAWTRSQSPARRHAADQLGVRVDAPPLEVRTAFMRQLPAAGFLPTPPLCAAVSALTGRPTPGSIDANAATDHEGLRNRVADFATEFWSLTPPVRRNRWKELLDVAVDDPPLAARLRRLEAGVDLPNQASGAGPPRLREVAGMIQSLFVLAPIERASRRREMLDNLPPPASAWEQTARQIQLHQPALAALEPGLVERLSHWRRNRRIAAVPRARPASSWGFQTQGGLQIPHVRATVVRPATRVSPSWIVFLAIGLVLGLIRAASSPSRFEPRFGTTLPPRSSAPSLPLTPTNWRTNSPEFIVSPEMMMEWMSRPLGSPNTVVPPGDDSKMAPRANPSSDRRPP